MQIDLNDPAQFTSEAVRQLIALGDSKVHNQLRVTRQGLAYLSAGVVGGTDIGNLSFRLETWAAGSGYVGPEAALDAAWVEQIFNALRQHWPTPKSDYIDIY
ncbi:hypothetical protein [Pseudomonas sp. nanlin1]|uniref:hypothetical protein n=1 Tax=Pseudomonas sp. nanlin1 TaxID=3040605 RepID=UPI00388E55FA